MNPIENLILFPNSLRRRPTTCGEADECAAFTAFAFIQTETPSDDRKLLSRLASLRQIREIHLVDGEDCYLVKISVEDPEALAHLLQNEIRCLKGVVSTRTLTVLRTLKDRASGKGSRQPQFA